VVYLSGNQSKISRNLHTLLQLVEGNLKALQGYVKVDKRKSFWFKLTNVVLSSSITFVLALEDKSIETWIALFLSSILSIVTAMDEYLDYHSKLVNEQKTLSQLAQLQLDIFLYLEGNINPTETKFDEFKQRYDQILSEHVNSINKRTENRSIQNKKEELNNGF
jgi:hypothetical protein